MHTRRPGRPRAGRRAAAAAPSSQSVFLKVMKNCELFVFLPALAIDRYPGPLCLIAKLSSAKVAP